MSQLNYNVNMDVAFEGMLADSGKIDALSKITEGASLEFGLGCALGTSDNQVAPLAAIADKFAGVVIHRHREEGELGDKVSVSVLRKGRIYVKVETDVQKGDAAFVRAVAVDPERAGAFRNSADGTDTIDLTGKAEFVTSALAGELAVLDINLP
jgi:hypothetical protein